MDLVVQTWTPEWSRLPRDTVIRRWHSSSPPWSPCLQSHIWGGAADRRVVTSSFRDVVSRRCRDTDAGTAGWEGGSKNHTRPGVHHRPRRRRHGYGARAGKNSGAHPATQNWSGSAGNWPVKSCVLHSQRLGWLQTSESYVCRRQILTS